jgi:hypothetical protein
MSILDKLKKELFETYSIYHFRIKENNITDKYLYLIEINGLLLKVFYKPEIFYLQETIDWLKNELKLNINDVYYLKILLEKYDNFYTDGIKKYNFISQIKYETDNFYLVEYFLNYIPLEYKHFLLEDKSKYIKYLLTNRSNIDCIKNSKLYKDISNSILNLIEKETINDKKFTKEFYYYLKKASNNFNGHQWPLNGNITIIPNIPDIINLINNINFNKVFNNVMVKIENNEIVSWKITSIQFAFMPFPTDIIYEL